MESSCLKKMSSQRYLEGLPAKKIKRLYHIKSVPAYTQESIRKPSLSKIDLHSKDEADVKLKRFKTHNHLKPPHFTAVKTARERNMDWAKRKQQSSGPSKSLTKSTAYRSPQEKESNPKSCSKVSKERRSLKKVYSSMLRRMQEVVEQYQLKLGRCMQQKQIILRENMRLKTQLQCACRSRR